MKKIYEKQRVAQAKVRFMKIKLAAVSLTLLLFFWVEYYLLQAQAFVI